MTKLPERNLDLLRCVAVLLVVLFHLTGTWWEYSGLAGAARMGVDLFFVHTALVLMSSLERERSRQVMGWIQRFYVRRAFRIYPLAIATVLVVVIFRFPPSPMVHQQQMLSDGAASLAGDFQTRGNIIADLLLVQNLTGNGNVLRVLWSLPVEVQMYLTLPLFYLIAIAGVSKTLNALAAVVLVGAFAFWGDTVYHVPGLWRLTVLRFGPCFVGGVLAYSLLRVKRPRLWPAWTWPVLLAAWGIVGLLICRINAVEVPREWPFCLGLSLTIPFVRELPTSLLTKAAHVVAKYSYGIYLLHMPAITIAFLWLHAPTVVRLAVFLVLMVAFPLAAFHLVEQPCIDLGKRVVERWTARPAANPMAEVAP